MTANQQEVFFWDMDHTIINNDCDVSWKEYLHAQGIAPQNALELADKYYQDYLNNCLDNDVFMDFQLAEFKGKTITEIAKISLDHFNTMVKKKIYPEAEKMVRQQLSEGKLLCLITATNAAIAKPLADYLGFDHVIASGLEIVQDKYTGKQAGKYCLGMGKVELMQDFFKKHGGSLQSAHYYGDSSADVVIMENIAYPHACNPAPKLKEAADKNNWEILNFG